MRKITTLNTLFTLLICLSGVINSHAQSETSSATSYTELFNVNNPFEMDLILDVKSFIKNKDTEEYLDAKIRYTTEAGETLEKNVKIRSRGNVRKRICYLPPIRMDFDDEDYQVDLFDSFGKVKLVSSCKVAANQEQFLLKEYLAYKIYENITPISFKTYFLKINFIDSQDKKKPYTSYSFFLEDIDDLAERNNAIEVENQNLLPVHLDRPTMNLFAMYQYLISNVDWHIPNLHNVKLIKSNDHRKPLPMPVPYDLDYAGLVSTNYAIPQERIPIESLTERYWMGTCITDEEFATVSATFLEQREEIYRLFEECEFLDNINKKNAVRFMKQYFDLLEKGDEVAKRTILKDCDQ